MPNVLATQHVLAVKNLAEATAYFVDVLGFSRDPVDVEGWSFLSLGSFHVMLGECPDDLSAAETNNHSYFAHVIVDDVDSLYASYAARGADFASPVADRPWGLREFCVRTPEGHRIAFAQEIG